MANPNNKVDKLVYNVEVETFPTYLIVPIQLQEINLRSRKILHQKYPIILEENGEEETPIQYKNVNNKISTKQPEP